MTPSTDAPLKPRTTSSHGTVASTKFTNPTFVCAGEQYSAVITPFEGGLLLALTASSTSPNLSARQVLISGGHRPTLRAMVVSSWSAADDTGRCHLTLTIPFAALAGTYDVTVSFASTVGDEIRSLTQTAELGSAPVVS